jgi:hypothetical protein
MSDPSLADQKGFLRHFSGLIRETDECADIDLRGSLRLGRKSTIRMPPPAFPLQILLGGAQGYRLHLYPELVIDTHGGLGHRGNYLLVDPQTYFSDISGFMRLHTGDSLTIGRNDPTQRLLLRYPRAVEQRHLRLKLSDKGLAIKNQSVAAGVCVAPLTAPDLTERMSRWRSRHLHRLARVLGGPIEPSTRADATDLIEQVVALIAREPYRALNHLGRPGGLLVLPHRTRPIFVGDLRARVDNLLVILTQNGFMDALEEGSATLIILGNAVHPDRPEQAAEMESSILMMDLIFRLKLRFPERIFYLRGHHDSFSEEISQAGLPQGSLWEDALHQARGPAYRDAMRRFYEGLPLVAATTSYLAAHGELPIESLGWRSLVDIDRHPDIAARITRSRPASPQLDDGYRRRELRRLFRRLGLLENAAVILGAGGESACGSRANAPDWPVQQHRLYSAGPDWVGTLTRAHRELLPLRYPVEPVTAVYNRLVRTDRMNLDPAVDRLLPHATDGEN